MNVLVTGGGGFIGSAVVRKLLERDVHVRSLARGDYPHLAQWGVEVVRGDLADKATVRRAVQGTDAVIHTAARAGVWGAREEYERANVLGTRNVVEACQQTGVRHLVMTSSPSVVFDGTDQAGVNESVPYPQRFLAHYPRTKAVAEKLVLAANSDKLSTVALRPHLVWGPGDPHLVPRVIARARAGALRIIGTCNEKPKLVDSTYVDNAADAHLLALDALERGNVAGGQAYFISNGEPLPMAEIMNSILAAAGLPPVERRISPSLAYAAGAALEVCYRILGVKTEPRMTRFVARQLSTAHWFDLTAAQRDLGYTPGVSLGEGFQRLAHWLSSQTPVNYVGIRR